MSIQVHYWSDWQNMPQPEDCRKITAPSGPGVYQVRNVKSKRKILFGIGKECQKRMKSLYPKPYGVGTRNNSAKREYILKHWQDLEYRTLETETRDQAKRIEDQIKYQADHLNNT